MALTTFSLGHSARAQTANWGGGGGDGLWNTAANWDIGVPAEGTNAVIGAGTAVAYSIPMVATSFAGLDNSSPLTVSAAGFNISSGAAAAYTGRTSSLLRISAGGVVTITNSGATTVNTDANMDVPGGVLVMTNNTGVISYGLNGNNNGAGFTNTAGSVIFGQQFQLRGRFSRFIMTGGTLDMQAGGGFFENSNDNERQWLINGGNANLGNFVLSRTFNTVGAGLTISNGVVNATSLQIGNSASRGSATVAGGVLTNTGAFTIADRTNAATSGERRVFFYVRGGSVYSTSSAGIVVANQPNIAGFASSTIMGGFLDINSGLVVAEKLTLVGPNAVTNAHATLTLAGTNALYLSTDNLVGNVGYSNTTYTMTLSGGTLGAKDDYAIVGNGTLSGTLTVKAADLANTAHNITNTGVWSGSGNLVKIGGGALTLASNNTYSGATILSAGTLALGASGSISNSPSVTLAGGTTFDVSAVGGGYVLNGGRTLAGTGTVAGNVTAASGSIINPGTNTANGTLVFANSVTEAGGVINHLDLSANPSGSNNDLISITGDLNVSGTNTVEIAGGGPPGSAHPLFQYGGSLNGTLANFALTGANGILSNNASAKIIYLVIQTPTRAPATNVVWQGSATVNDWDVLGQNNWLTNGVATYFVTGDRVVFNATGAAHPNVNLVGNLAPASVTVDAAANYAFSGSGILGGTGTSLTKTNSGTLTISTANSYTGPTIISGGALEVTTLATGGNNSGIGASGAGEANLVLYGSTLRYLGSSVSTDRGATFTNADGTFDVASNSTSVTVSGTLAGNAGLIKAGPGTLIVSGSGAYIGATTISNGTLQINAAATAIGTNAINFAGGTVSLNVGGQPTYANTLNVLAPSTLISAGGNNNLLTGPWFGAATLNLNIASGTFTINADMGTNYTGTILVTSNSTANFRFNGGGGNPATGSDFATFDLGNSSAALINRNGAGVVYHLGGLGGAANTQLRGSENTGSGSIYQIGANNLNTTFAGTIKTGNGGTTAAVTLWKVGTGTLTLAGTNTYNGSTIISNGVLALSAFGSFGNSPIIAVTSNSVLAASARTDGTLTLASGQTLQGEGTVRGSVTVGSGASLTPGDTAGAIGRLTITNALVLQAGSTLTMDLDYDLALGGGTNDVVTGLASVTYGGTLNLNITSIETNSIFKLFNAAAYHGAFDAISPALPPVAVPGLVWDTSFLTVDGTLRITVPHPGFGGITQQGASMVLSGTNGLPFANYYVLTSTNLSLPFASWTPIATNAFEFDGTFSFTNAIDPNAQQQFYRLQVP